MDTDKKMTVRATAKAAVVAAMAAKKRVPKIRKTKKECRPQVDEAERKRLKREAKKAAIKNRKDLTIPLIKRVRAPRLSDKSRLPDTSKEPKRLFLGNLPKTATQNDVQQMLRRFARNIKSVSLLMATGSGKKTIKNEEGKVIPQCLGAAFVQFKTAASMKRVMKQKELVLQEHKIRTSVAIPKKKHVKKMARQKVLKRASIKDREVIKKVVRETMQANMKKNLKAARKSRTKKGREARKAAEEESKKDGVSKPRCVAKPSWRRSERRKLSGDKAKKAMARQTRK